MFVKYSSIDNPPAFFKQNAGTVFKPDEWLVTEKVHGANFAFICTEDSIVGAKRSGRISEDEHFYGFRTLIESHRSGLVGILNTLRAKHPKLPRVTVFGELYGGTYPHPDLPKLNAKHVQKEIKYRPDVGFYGFDIRLEFSPEDRRFLQLEEAIDLFNQFGIFCVQILDRGPLDKMSKFDPHFPTTIPERLGLPPLPNNFSEGVVVRHVASHSHFKIKSDAFRECTGQAVRPVKVRGPASASPAISEPVAALINTLLCYITPQRLVSVLSKLGESKAERRACVGLLVSDALAEFKRSPESNDETTVVLNDKNNRKVIMATLTVEAAEVAKEYFAKEAEEDEEA